MMQESAEGGVGGWVRARKGRCFGVCAGPAKRTHGWHHLFMSVRDAAREVCR